MSQWRRGAVCAVLRVAIGLFGLGVAVFGVVTWVHIIRVTFA